MYSWRTIRTFCVVLLCLPLIHLAVIVSRDLVATLDSSPNAWAREIEDYVSADRQATLPRHPVVVIGGRRVKLWDGLEDVLAPQPVLMRGLGDATIEDIIYHYERLVAFYHPSTVVFLPSDSEFHIRDSKSEDEFVRALGELAALDAEHGPDWRFIVFVPIKTPLHQGDYAKIDAISEKMRAWAASDPRLHVIDANAFLIAADGRPNPAYFRHDGINFNRNGYGRLELLLARSLQAQPSV